MEYQILGVALWLGIVLVAAELVARFSPLGGEVSRKIVHIGVGNVILLAWWLRIPTEVGVAAAVLSGVATLISYWYPLLASVSGVGRKSWGTFFYSVSIGLLIAYFWPRGLESHAALGVLVMTWGDGLAALIGQRFGSHRYEVWGMTKSWEGTATMAIASTLVSGAILISTYGLSWPIGLVSLLVAILATGLEAFSKFGVDNLTVPLGSAFISFALVQWWAG
ncbi:diacylglycerol/polyprenol kinase family protein [Altericista sp. CCNU0014]|uniref:diacylglycerol/polyprenol kinase family protein n=1 Tax=Altericista sp. CCNU0014 TaxID=3082949 RepID=UPI00384AE989